VINELSYDSLRYIIGAMKIVFKSWNDPRKLFLLENQRERW